ncbi:MAG: hypothetical protein GEU90_00670 [Gemmatimonas sp.]|nr:hypothetical protein [Gemmatimonas sp.]
MYAARPLVLKATGGEIWKNSAYFTQTLLKDYVEDFAPDWRLVWDARGHLREPHTGRTIGLGGLEVMKYVESWTNGKFEATPKSTIPAKLQTKGPHLRFGAALFIEKEGFDEILRDAGLEERYDLAIFSSKGLPIKAVFDVARPLHHCGIKILVAHDFDLAGFKIARTMRQGTRLTSGVPIIDIGLRLPDIEGLDSEPVDYSQQKDPRPYLRRCGATEEEAAFLVQTGDRRGWAGDRVELNAMTSEELIDWLERKLDEHGVGKVIPDREELSRAYQRAVFRKELESAAVKIASRLPKVDVPDDLPDRVKRYLDEYPEASWDEAVVEILADED